MTVYSPVRRRVWAERCSGSSALQKNILTCQVAEISLSKQPGSNSQIRDRTSYIILYLSTSLREQSEFVEEMTGDRTVSKFLSNFNEPSTFLETLYFALRYLFASLVVNLNLHQTSLEPTERELEAAVEAGERKGKWINNMESDNPEPIKVSFLSHTLLESYVAYQRTRVEKWRKSKKNKSNFPSSYQSSFPSTSVGVNSFTVANMVQSKRIYRRDRYRSRSKTPSRLDSH